VRLQFEIHSGARLLTGRQGTAAANQMSPPHHRAFTLTLLSLLRERGMNRRTDADEGVSPLLVGAILVLSWRFGHGQVGMRRVGGRRVRVGDWGFGPRR